MPLFLFDKQLYGALVAASTFLCCGVVSSYTSGAIYSIQTDVESNITLSQSNISWIGTFLYFNEKTLN